MAYKIWCHLKVMLQLYHYIKLICYNSTVQTLENSLFVAAQYTAKKSLHIYISPNMAAGGNLRVYDNLRHRLTD